MDAWETLIANSTIPDGDAWEHLNNQGGSGPGGSLVLLDGLEVEVNEYEFDVEVEQGVEVLVDTQEFEVEVETKEYEIEV